MDFVNRLVERTHSVRAALRPVGPASPVNAGAAEPLLSIDEVSATRGEAAAPSGVGEVIRQPNEPAHGAMQPSATAPITLTRPAHAIESRIPPPLVVEIDAAAVPDRSMSHLVNSDEGERAIAHAQPSIMFGATIHPARPSTHAAARTAPPRTASALTPSPDASGDQVIRIHIGRVDVRAPSPAPGPAPTAKRVAEPLPSVALGRYLDDRGRRR